jgi:hypothetical protein
MRRHQTIAVRDQAFACGSSFTPVRAERENPSGAPPYTSPCRPYAARRSPFRTKRQRIQRQPQITTNNHYRTRDSDGRPTPKDVRRRSRHRLHRRAPAPERRAAGGEAAVQGGGAQGERGRRARDEVAGAGEHRPEAVDLVEGPQRHEGVRVAEVQRQRGGREGREGDGEVYDRRAGRRAARSRSA